MQAQNHFLTLTHMKKSIYLALTAVVLTLFACNSKPASEQYPAPDTDTVAIEIVETDTLELIVDNDTAALSEEVIVDEQPAEEPAAEEPAAAETAQEQPAEEAEEEGTVFLVVSDQPVPPFDRKDVVKFLTVNLNDVDPNADQCRVMVQVIVEKDARLTHHTIKRSSGNEKLDAYAIQFVKEKLPRFKSPGKQSGSPVRTSFILPVTFLKQ